MSIQVPNLHTSNTTKANANAEVFIVARKDASHAGVFRVRGTFAFNPATGTYPTGALTIDVDLSDSAKGVFSVKTVEQLDSTGKHTPTLFATGRCSADINQRVAGLRYWLMLVDNKLPRVAQTPDVISFLIYDRAGKRVAYGTGPVAKGDVVVAPSAE